MHRDETLNSDALNRRVKCEDCETTLYPGAEECEECGSTHIDSNWNDFQSAYQKHDIGEAYFVGRMHQIGLQVEHWGIDMRDDDGDGLIFDEKMDLRLWEPLDGQDEPPNPPDTFEGFQWVQKRIDGDRNLYEIATESNSVDTIADKRLTEHRWDLRGLVDIKTKANEDWMGVLNLRHFVHYCMWAREMGAPTFLYFTMVDMDAEMVGEENILVPLEPFDHLDAYIDHFNRNIDYVHDWSQITEDCPLIERSFRAPDGNPVVKIDSRAYENFNYLVKDVL